MSTQRQLIDLELEPGAVALLRETAAELDASPDEVVEALIDHYGYPDVLEGRVEPD